SPQQVALAEQLGYGRAWLYDTPQQSPDVWMTLALAAERTERIGLGPAGGPGLALAYHGAYEFNMPLSELPGGAEWQAVIDQMPPAERHLSVHGQHCVGLNEADQAAWPLGGTSFRFGVAVRHRPINPCPTNSSWPLR
ncbi:MAG: LLM class flavin-dependent oxidoreductase, partial [Solirubrobacteraceae bacterium]